MKLYFSPFSCSMSPHIALVEAGVNFELVKVNLPTHTIVADGSDFQKVAPKGYVPALQLDDGSLLTEGVVIVQYIADLKPELLLAPKSGTMARYRLQEWLVYINSEIHKNFGPLFNPATPDAFKTIVRENLSRRLAYAAAHLEKNEFLMGSQFSVADGYLFTALNWGQWTGIDVDQWASFKAYRARVGARPAVKAVLAAEAAAAAG